MKLKERIVWILAVVILGMSTAALWAVVQVNGQVWGNDQYLNYMERLRLQQTLESDDLDAAAASNREWLSLWLSIFTQQEELGKLIVSEEQLEIIRREAESLDLDPTPLGQ